MAFPMAAPDDDALAQVFDAELEDDEPASALAPTKPAAMPIGGGRELRPLSEDEVKSIVSGEIQDALGASGSELAEERSKAMAYYMGKPFGNEIEGRSQVQIQDVRDTVEWAMPHLMKMLAGGETLFRYKPASGADTPEAIARAQAQADQATDYLGMVFEHELDGWLLLYDLFKSGLLGKRAYGKVYVDRRMEPRIESYHGLDEEEFDALLDEEGVTPISHSVRQETLPIQGPDGQPVVAKLHDVRIRRLHERVKLCVDLLAPEEMLIARRALKLDDDISFTAQRKKVRLSDLIAMGMTPEQAMELPLEDTPEWDRERVERLSEDESWMGGGAERADPASRELWITDCHLHIDADGDGYSELRQITVVGESGVTVIHNDYENWNPFFSVCPIPIPHKLVGFSLADLVMDLHLIRSTIARQVLDNFYQANNSRMKVLEGRVNTDDLLVSRPGGMVRVRQMDAVEPLEVQMMGREGILALEFFEGVKENRTGITRYSQGSDSSNLNKTATGISRIMNAAFARLETISEIYAHQMKRLGKLLLRAMVEGGFKERVVRLRGQWVTVDPSTWDADMDVEVETGLGVGQAAERQSALTMVMGVQKEMVGAGLSNMVTPDNLYRAACELTKSVGFRNEGMFFTDPKSQPPPQPPPDPDMEKLKLAQGQQQIDTQQSHAELQLRAQESKDLAEFRKQELATNAAIEQQKITAEFELKRMELASKERIEKEKARAVRVAAKEQAKAAAKKPAAKKGAST